MKKIKEGETACSAPKGFFSTIIECEAIKNGKTIKWTITGKKLLEYAWLTRPS